MARYQPTAIPPVPTGHAVRRVATSTDRATTPAWRATSKADDPPTDAPSRAAVYEYTFTRRRIAEPMGSVRTPDDAAAILRDFLRPDEAEQERLVVALLNIKNVVIGVETIYIGNTSGSSVRVGEVFRSAVRLNASALVVAHNHPSGDPTPSTEDVSITLELARAGRTLDIDLLDHVILGHDGRSASMRALGHLPDRELSS